MPILTDEQIVAKVQRGDAESFAILVDRYSDKITRYGRKFASNRADIEDLVQEVFIKSYINIQSFDTKRKFSSWLYRIAHNEFINALKKKGREALLPFDFDTLLPQFVAKETADQDIHDKELKEVLTKCLDEINLKYREPLVLYYFEEMDYNEIAEILRIPINTVGVRLSRGKAILKKKLYELYPTYKV